MLKVIKHNTTDPTESTIVETIIKLVKYGVKSGNSVWAERNNTQEDVYRLTRPLPAKTLGEINLILRSALGLEVDRHFVLRKYSFETIELPDRLKNIVDNLFGPDIYKAQEELSRKNFTKRCWVIHEIMAKNISYSDFEILDALETSV